MMKNIRLLMLLKMIVLTVTFGYAQSLRPLDHTVYDSWKQIDNYHISNDGSHVVYEINPQKGDGFLFFNRLSDKAKDSISRGAKARFSPNSNFLVYRIMPPFDTVRAAKMRKVKKDKMPKDSVGISLLNGVKSWRYAGLKQFSVPEKASDWVALLIEKPIAAKAVDTTITDTLVQEKQKKKDKSKKKKNEGGLLVLMNPVTGDSVAFQNINYFSLSDEGNTCAMISQSGDSIDSLRVSVYLTDKKIEKQLLLQAGCASGINIDQQGKQVAFTYSSDTAKQKNYQLCYADLKKDQVVFVSGDSLSRIARGWAVSEYLIPYFHENGSELYFGTAPIPDPVSKDTLTDDEKVSLDVWNWRDDRIQPQQLKQLERDKKKYYSAVYYPAKDKIIQLGDVDMPEIRIDKKSKGEYSLGYNHLPYLHNSSWDAGNYRDVFLVNRETGGRVEIIRKASSSVSLSPDQKNVLWYNKSDSSWNAYHIEKRLTLDLTSHLDTPFYNELNDVPRAADPYGMAGWTKQGHAVVYDEFDLWELDPSNKYAATNITGGNGRTNFLRYRFVKLDTDKVFLPEVLFLSTFNKRTKDAGISSLDIKKGNEPQVLVMEPVRFSTPRKAKHAQTLIWRKESFEHYPDLYTGQIDFKVVSRLTNANPQQDDYAWGSVDMVSWNTFAGDSMQGLLYKPANFDSEKSYPMLVYFYERYSDNLHRHYVPKPIRSVINFSYYASNGYVIFIPDIKYKTGYPGESAFNCIISGTQAMLERYSFIDRSRLGIQGQSWGGYQTAFLITQTNMFAAAMAGAPVSNMTSAYGGIRWGSGINRAFQYEQTQSRIGATLWEDLPLYLANSPLFFADRVETPLLIMHNDNDGAVPWYQGIELFNALRRLDKPVWMLVYNGAPHNLSRRADCEDLSVRMQQFFDHYLQGAPEPVWMKTGIPALSKGKSFGFEME